jgi:serine protease
VAGADAVPADATAVVANVTVTDTTATSHLTVSPAGDPVPTVSDLNWTAGKNVPNLVIATVGAGGQVDLTDFAGSTDVIVDVVGWFVTPV